MLFHNLASALQKDFDIWLNLERLKKLREEAILVFNFALVTRRPYCPGGPKKPCFTTLSLIPMVSIARLSVVKQSSFGIPGQYGRRVTKVNGPINCPVVTSRLPGTQEIVHLKETTTRTTISVPTQCLDAEDFIWTGKHSIVKEY